MCLLEKAVTSVSQTIFIYAPLLQTHWFGPRYHWSKIRLVHRHFHHLAGESRHKHLDTIVYNAVIKAGWVDDGMACGPEGRCGEAAVLGVVYRHARNKEATSNKGIATTSKKLLVAPGHYH